MSTSNPNPLLQKQEGGFMMSDKKIFDSDAESLYTIMEAHFNKPGNKPFFESVLQQKDAPPNIKDLSFLESSPYTEIYTKLLNIIMTDAEYTQTFVYNDGTPKYESKMHNYHIQLCALMTMSFLFELELFSVVHNYIPMNIGTTNSNTLPSTFHFAESTPALRYYKDSITKGSLDAMLEYFTRSLDTFFDEFMKKLLDEINRLINFYHAIITPQEILEAVVPVKSIKPPHDPGKFDYIYVDWKDRIKEKIKKKPALPDHPNPPTVYGDEYYSICINMAIQNALNHVEYGGSKYIAEGTGFFSFLYLLPKPGVVEDFNGSCITYSMLELYIMARLHVHANTLTLNMESGHGDRPHGYWNSVQKDTDIKLSSVTHWATQYEFQSLPLYFRSIPDYRGQIKTKHLFNFVDPDKTNLCLLLLYPIFDSYIRYIDQPDADIKMYPAEIAKILPFIHGRIQFVKTLFSRKSEKVVIDEKGLLISGSKSEVDKTTITLDWFKNVFGFAEDAANFAKNHKSSFDVKTSASDYHILMTVKSKEIDIGVFRYVSVAQLLKTASDNPSARSVFGFDSTRNNLKYYTMTSTSRAIHINPSYHDSIFQVASQFNALEMPSPKVTPQAGITSYYGDPTQGPECAIMCPFGTLYRNYFCMPSASTNEQPADKSINTNPQTGIDAAVDGSVNNQINTLAELMKKTTEFNKLTFQNGYIIANDQVQLDAINKYLSTPENFWNAMMAIKYVIQEDTPVVNAVGDGQILDHIVSQIYCSAYPVAYSKLRPEQYYLLSSMILHAVYYSTLAYAVSRITPDEPRKKVFLTRVGGGVFKNENYIIDTAIYNAVSHFIAYPIDVYIVGYETNAKDQAIITDPKEITENLQHIIVTNPPIPGFETAPYTDIQKMLAEKAKAETEQVKKATEEMVTKKKEEETKLRSTLKKSKSTEEEEKEKLDEEKEKLDKAAALYKENLEEKAKAKAEKEKAKAEKIHEEKAKKKHLKLTAAIDEAIRSFSNKLKDGDDKKYGDILLELGTKIREDREGRAKAVADAGADAISRKSKTKGTGKKLEPKLGSREMTKDQVNTFITEHNEDAIFVVTGGSFNPPHNGHIGMFQKAYEELKAKGKKVYGVMVPATEGWLDTKVADNKLDKSQKIDIKYRVDLCKLSCDSYNWTSDPAKFNASNMIVVNEGDNSPANSILRTSDGKYRPNAYYLCGSDYYASSGGGPYKFICVLRSGVTFDSSNRRLTFAVAPIPDNPKTDFEVKGDDIIVEDAGGDNEASSTMLRNILTEISKVKIEDGLDVPALPTKEKLLSLISIPVLRRLLDLKYILTDTDKNKKVLRIMDIDLDEEADKAERAKNMDQVVGTIELNVDIGSDVRDAEKRVTKKFNRIETGGGGDCLFHTLRYLLTTAGKIKPTGDKTVDMMKIRNAIVDHVKTLGDEFKHLQVTIGDKLDFKKINETLSKDHSGKSDSEIAKLNINVDGAVRIDGNRLLFADRVVTFKQDLGGHDKHMKYVSQDTTQTYFTVMREKGIYGTEFELGIAAALYDIMLCVISHEGRCQYYIFDKAKNEVRGNEPGEYERIKKNIWYIYNYTNTHYQYLECIDAPAECPDPVKP
jgi:hypothetical protein